MSLTPFLKFLTNLSWTLSHNISSFRSLDLFINFQTYHLKKITIPIHHTPTTPQSKKEKENNEN